MKRLLSTAAVLLTVMLMPLAFAAPKTSAYDIFSTCGSGSANGTPDVCQSVKAQDKSGSNPVITVLKAAIEVISYVVGAAAIIIIIVSGIRFIVSGGDSNAVAGARTGLIYALIGIGVVALSQIIVLFVLDKIK